MNENLAQEAVDAALACDWKKAISVNSKIIKSNREDVDALNRIARAYAESGDMLKAKSATGKVLKIDPTNPIANKCLVKWQNYKNGTTNGSVKLAFKINELMFIEEHGKTKIVELINVGEGAYVTMLNCGVPVKLVPHIHRVNVVTMDDKYVGRFPDDLAHKFIKLMRLGNDYEAVVKSASDKQVRIFLRADAKSAL